jgi:hypothetical protein
LRSHAHLIAVVIWLVVRIALVEVPVGVLLHTGVGHIPLHPHLFKSLDLRLSVHITGVEVVVLWALRHLGGH